MTQHQKTKSRTGLNPNLVAFIFIFNFVVIGGMIIYMASSNTAASDAADGVEVALVDSTNTPAPSLTPLPPTATQSPVPSSTPTELPTATSTPQVIAETNQAENVGLTYDPVVVEHGEQLFTLCAACHGADARGIPNLGKDLVNSEFVAGLTDDELVQFIVTGRPIWDPLNTIRMSMPSSVGNPALTTEEIHAMVAYIRTLSAEDSGEAEAAPAGSDYDPAVVSQGEQFFVQCAACHGSDGRGIPNLGKDLIDSEFVAGLTDDELLTFIKTGRPIWDPQNTTGLDMPAKGGNPALTDEHILAIIAYIRTLSESGG